MTVDPDVLIVVATIVGIFSLSSIISSWVQIRWPRLALVSFIFAVAILFYVHTTKPEGLQPVDIPEAFITVTARLLN